MKRSVRFLSFLLALSMCAVGFFAACGGGDDKGKLDPTDPSKILVAYFSATGNTETAAGYIAEATGATLYEIVPAEPYTSADLNYNDSNSRATREQRDPDARPAIQGRVGNMESFDVLFLGYPIWHGAAPKIIYTFLESYDLSGKAVVPFCTSASSPIGNSANDLHGLALDATWLEGRRFPSSVSERAVGEWVDSLGIDPSGDRKGEHMTETVFLTIGGRKIAVKLEQNAAAAALVALLQTGEVTYAASEYGGFEKVGALGHALPRSDSRMTTAAGDVVLYEGDRIVLFYGSNTWSYTKLGAVQGLSAAEWKAILTACDPLTVTIGL